MSFLDQERWKPPNKEDRELRTNFYGPITDELLRKSLAEMNQGDDNASIPTNNLNNEPLTEQKTKKKREYFMWWQDKKCVNLFPAVEVSQYDKCRYFHLSYFLQTNSFLVGSKLLGGRIEDIL